MLLLDLFTCLAEQALEKSSKSSGQEKENILSNNWSQAEPRSDLDESDDKAPLESLEPRQYFRVHSMANAKKLSRLAFQTTGGRKRQPAESGGGDLIAGLGNQKTSKPKISNATLKKLLNQSLLKSANGSTAPSLSKAGSNFKFVFIQRATASPKLHYQANSLKNLSSAADSSDTSSPTSSLAASVSRQLASSLLNSAAGLMSNLTSAAGGPSISLLANQLATIKGQSTDLHTTDSTNIEQTKRPNKRPSASQNSYGSGSKGKPKRPSKIYNLPVKFVSNGQPNNVVISTIKQHFASIKKLQAGARLTPGASHSSSSSSPSSSTGISALASPISAKNRKKPQQKLHQKIGTNSRFIYLPIRYLSNAKVNKIMITAGNRATHKSTN